MVADVDESLIEKQDAQLLAYYAQYFHTEAKGMSLGKTKKKLAEWQEPQLNSSANV